MAQDQKIEYLFNAQVTGQGELAKLTQSVEKLREEMNALKTANGGLAAGTTAFTKSIGNASSHVQAYQKHLDAQAKAMRNHRQGTQQLGLQFNDLGTSISTGASPIQAFNQQIGQMGYAMSMMGGKMGAVGSFLAGPFGAAVVIATMVLAPLIEGLLNTGAAAQKAADQAKKLEKHERDLAENAGNLIIVRAQIDEALGKNVDSFLVAQQVAVDLARIEIESAKESIRAAKLRLVAANANIRANKALQVIGSVGNPGLSIFGSIREYFQGNEAKIEKENDDLRAITDSMEKLEVKLLAGKRDRLERDNDIADKNAKKGLAAANKLAAEQERQLNQANKIAEKVRDMGLVYGATSKEVGTTAKKLDDFNDMVEELGTLSGGPKILQDLAGTIDLVRQGIVNEGANKALSDFNQEIDKLMKKDLSPFEQSISSLLDKRNNPELKFGDAEKAKFDVGVNTRAGKFFDDAIAAQTDLLDKANGVDNTFRNQVTSLEAIIEEMTALGAPTDKMVAKLKEFNALNEDTKITEKNKELVDSFNKIGESVAGAFKGMVTGAMSFSSAMKSIISSVIDELFRLYVVQQIVGIVKTGLTSIGLPVPTGKAIGGSVAKNTPYMVGEQGPELFIPGGSGTIIPNRNLSGGGNGGSSFNITVDARGSNDPAAVRAQVQQGILEAAPAIIAAAEARTVSSLRRPRLGGAMQ